MLALAMIAYLCPFLIPLALGSCLLGGLGFALRALFRFLRRLEDQGHGWAVLLIILAVIFPLFIQ